NLYHDGSEGMGWHSDDEKTLGRNPVIASVSFGAERVFKLKHRESNEVVSVLLENGSLLVNKQRPFVFVLSPARHKHRQRLCAWLLGEGALRPPWCHAFFVGCDPYLIKTRRVAL
ncbi:MAG: hypothetical protein EBZ69_03975, partial [Alphaproteobacteria bacterium]|nr:hypothetical protein [Alphaproteobacteria bacterium]